MATRITPQGALRSAVEAIGSQSAMARLLGVSQPTVWSWLAKEQFLPSEHVLTIERETGISRHDLRPDIYPRDDAPPAAPSSPDLAPVR